MAAKISNRVLALAVSGVMTASSARAATWAHASPAYGDNPAAGATFVHDGVQLYYEVYGAGPPLLLIHGNGASISAMKNQIAYFRHHYKVIAMDSRDHGKSGDAPGALTFEAMSDDLAALLVHLHTGPTRVLGWSDGAIEALLLGMRHPDQVSMIAAMAANLDPDGLKQDDPPRPVALPPRIDAAHPGTRAERVDALDAYEPHIRPDDLEAIRAPTLVLASDHDVIADEHTLVIYHHLPNSELAIFPDASHMIPQQDPARFNAVVDRFFRTPFVKRGRFGNLVKAWR